MSGKLHLRVKYGQCIKSIKTHLQSLGFSSFQSLCWISNKATTQSGTLSPETPKIILRFILLMNEPAAHPRFMPQTPTCTLTQS